MKKYYFGLLLFGLWVSCFSCKEKKETLPVGSIAQDTVVVIEDTIPRTSITFILGKDHFEFNKYYELANYYYRLNPEDRTEVVIDTMVSILEVCNYLRNHPPANGRPYGLINLVSHGNEFIDLRALVYPKGPRASVKTLTKAINDSVFSPLDTSIIDRQSLIYLHGCAIGNNKELLNSLATAFGSEQNGVRVKASKYFEYYGYLSKNKNPQSIRHYYAKTWYAFYHPDSVPNTQGFVERLKKRYPQDRVNWEEGVNRRFQSNPSEIYHYSFVVPATWDEFYKEEGQVPNVNSRAMRQQWVKNNQPFQDLLAQSHVPLEYFQIKFYKPNYTSGDKQVHALHVKAKAGVLCLIQPVLSDVDSLRAQLVPYQPAADDLSFFEFSEIPD